MGKMFLHLMYNIYIFYFAFTIYKYSRDCRLIADPLIIKIVVSCNSDYCSYYELADCYLQQKILRRNENSFVGDCFHNLSKCDSIFKLYWKWNKTEKYFCFCCFGCGLTVLSANDSLMVVNCWFTNLWCRQAVSELRQAVTIEVRTFGNSYDCFGKTKIMHGHILLAHENVEQRKCHVVIWNFLRYCFSGVLTSALKDINGHKFP